MDRRKIMLTLAAGLAAGSASAQTGHSAAPGMTQAEMDHAKKTAMTGAVALQTSDIALSKATNAKVKQFATFEHDEQTLAAEILKSMGHTDPGPDPKMASAITKLRSMGAGAQFDKDYVMAQIEGHDMLLQIQEDYLKAGKNREHVNVAKLIRGMVKEHLALLDDLKKAMA